MIFRKKKINEQHPDFPVLSDTSYRKVLAFLEEKLVPEWYLEIGSRTGDSLRSIKGNYIAIDPEFCVQGNVLNKSKAMLFFQQTSDDFFDSGFLERSGIKPDFAFIDGMHLFEFALRDFMNLEKVMSERGVICFHDVCPFNYEMTTRDLSYLDQGRPWTGDVWKTIAALVDKRPDLDIKILNAHKTGLAVVTKLDAGNRVLQDSYDELLATYVGMELKDIGASAYYSRFDLMSAERYIAEGKI